MGLMAGRQAGRLTDEIQVDFKLFTGYGFLFCLIYHCNITIVLEVHLSQLLSIKFIIRHVLKCKKLIGIFSCQSLLYSTNIVNHIKAKDKSHIKITLMDKLKG